MGGGGRGVAKTGPHPVVLPPIRVRRGAAKPRWGCRPSGIGAKPAFIPLLGPQPSLNEIEGVALRVSTSPRPQLDAAAAAPDGDVFPLSAPLPATR